MDRDKIIDEGIKTAQAAIFLYSTIYAVRGLWQCCNDFADWMERRQWNKEMKNRVLK